jgi:MFS family permease
MGSDIEPDIGGDVGGGSAAPSSGVVELGLGPNRGQAALLVSIVAFVGAMVGLERTVLPLLAEQEFGLLSSGVTLSFLVSFGVVKAATNFFAGRLGDRYGRKPILIIGWLLGIPVPFMIMWAPSWGWIVAANMLLGVNQGLTWSTNVIMMIDLAGPRQRGLAMGLNEFAGYTSVALSALATGYIAQAYGLRPEPFYLGIAFAALGLGLSTVFLRETHGHARSEAEQAPVPAGPDEAHASVPGTRELLALTAWKHPALSSAGQAGLVNNLNDGVAWGLFPLFFAASGLGVADIGILSFVYPFTWGVLQLWTGAWSDRVGRKRLIVGGMLLQGIALGAIAMSDGFAGWIGASALLGVGTAMVYPTLLASVGDVAGPSWRGSAVGVFRLWRDSGYAVGGVMAGVLADAFGMRAAIGAVAVLTALSGLVVAIRMPETLEHRD